MNKNIETEVAIEIISMYIAIEYKNNNFVEVEKLKSEKEKIYRGYNCIIEKVIKEYATKVKEMIS